jgi:hypothetical protein
MTSFELYSLRPHVQQINGCTGFSIYIIKQEDNYIEKMQTNIFFLFNYFISNKLRACIKSR